MRPRNLVILWVACMAAILAIGLSVNASEKSGKSSVKTSASPKSPAPTSAASPSQPSGSAACSPNGTTINLVAKSIAFDSKCLAAPASKAFVVNFSNQDSGVSHNFAILTTSGKALFTGAIIQGVRTTTYHVSALPPGTYRFQCDVHPTVMFGTFVVK